MNHQHPFHLVNQSPWPITASFGALTITSGLAIWFNNGTINILLIGIIATTLTSINWWRDVIRESTFQGHHTLIVTNGLRYGMILFITSEVCFFFAFFWAFFHSSLAPSIEIGVTWPPTGINPINPFLVPLLNTAVLLSSGISITWCHHSILNSNRNESIQALSITVILGIYFTTLQLWEYNDAPFSIADSIYGSTFFVATGFHGLHVIIGTTFLLVCLIRLINNHFSNKHHFGFEAAAWYWHFVDVVWLFLYICIYWWGS
uniref:Cytochrome c oxidase subunit 3 n=1 Tax=Colochirus quadrangularis TaxID=1980634 RepID=A0A7G7MWM1_9ECHN|nr:cytochrome c oxidase subunit III [Colochirus quadrangularis]QNG57230.1 cytochrome c oxidase subunit 3 [Colochirus quadrangularis]QQY85578.1 cytochrome c oxidase subunit 3 [Colochirus quadrangularis]